MCSRAGQPARDTEYTPLIEDCGTVENTVPARYSTVENSGSGAPIQHLRIPHGKSGGSKIETYFTKIVFNTVDYDICICFLAI